MKIASPHQIATTLCSSISQFLEMGYGIHMAKLILEMEKNCSIKEHPNWRKFHRSICIQQISCRILFSLGLLFSFTSGALVGGLTSRRQWRFIPTPLLFFSFGAVISFFAWYILDIKLRREFYSSLLVWILASESGQLAGKNWKLFKQGKADITHLNLTNNQFSQQPIMVSDQELRQIATVCPSLKSLTLLADQLTAHSLKVLRTQCPKLKELHLHGELNFESRDYLVFEDFTQLRHLTIKQATHLFKQGFRSISHLASRSLQTLSIRSPHISVEVLENFCSEKKHYLFELKIYSDQLKPADFAIVTSQWKNMKSLEKLKFSIHGEKDKEEVNTLANLMSCHSVHGFWHSKIDSKKGKGFVYFVENTR